MDKELREVAIYTDGAAEPNPGPGGYGVVLVYKKHRKELSGGFRRTTNNRMEILAAIASLEALSMRCAATIYSDSQYLVDAVTKGWARRWRANGWKRKGGAMALNPDLWARLLTLCARHRVRFVWVRGHAGHAENERCDFLATQAARGENLPRDIVYEDGNIPLRTPQMGLFDSGYDE